ncbi:zinc transporter, putative [Entamoeba invadens IP1]|uniref:zinc transporter, putative n=1 Tax=Entamoeba invadens IP1 TaxID=370355 RepID=UPI0002C3D943|nr:zinc transporter, putative [Entamoeba invadens IP1]ELP93401.1 zinc transporter, putative [Entamoeba invadens IP1]|eukprot:XP_004260172.1 zinc transporter, putative [Entamoeba invadens IP1]
MLDYLLSIYILVCYFVSVIGGFIPFFIKFLPNRKLAGDILDVCSASAGGLFLSGGLMHMLAEGTDLIDKSGYDFMGLPLGFFCCGLSFLFIFFFDRVVATHGGHVSFAQVESPRGEVVQPLLTDAEEKKKEPDEKKKQNEIQSHHHHEEEEEGNKGWCSIITLIFALSIHSFFEGLGLGVSTSPTAIFIAIAGHKWADSGFTVIFLMSKIQNLLIISIIILIFSTFTPIGSLVGVLIVELMGESPVSSLIQGLLICLAAGTFLYVAIVEILAEQFENGKYKYIKFTLAVILFLAMSFVTMLEGD